MSETEIRDEAAAEPDGVRRRPRIRVGGGRGHRPPARPDIEGLRALAVALVLLLHAGLPPRGGFIGVDVFFVISGFLMTSILFRELLVRGTVSTSGFYARRARRLLPAAATVLLATAVGTLLLVPKIRWPDIGKDILASALYVQNWRLASVATDYNAHGLVKSPLQHFWSLAVEEQFYIVWPLLLLAAAWVVRQFRELELSESQAQERRGRGMSASDAAVSLSIAVVVVLVPSLIWSIHLTSANPAAAYFVTTTRLWEVAVGGAAALAAAYLPSSRPRVTGLVGWLGLAVVVAAAFVLSDQTPFPGAAALAPTLGTAVVIVAGVTQSTWGPTRVLGLRPFRWLGKLSYSLYLWHWPLLIIVAAKYGELSTAQSTAVVAASIVPAYLSFRFVEDPVRHAKSLVSQPRRSLSAGAALTVLSVLTSAVVLGATWPPAPPPTPVVSALNDGNNGSGASASPGSATASAAPQPKIGALVLGNHPRNNPAGQPKDKVASITPDPLAVATDVFRPSCVTVTDESTPRACVLGDSGSSVNVALIGDLHAGQMMAPLDNIASSRGWKLTVYVKRGCEFASGVDPLIQGGTPYPECAAWNTAVQAALKDLNPSMIIVSNVNFKVAVDGKALSLDDSFDPLAAGYQAAWAPTLAHGGKVVAIRDSPTPGEDVPECVSVHTTSLKSCSYQRSDALPSTTPLQKAAKKTPGATWVDVDDWICPTDQCAPVIGGVLIWRDNDHLSATYAATLAPYLDKLIPDP